MLKHCGCSDYDATAKGAGLEPAHRADLVPVVFLWFLGVEENMMGIVNKLISNRFTRRIRPTFDRFAMRYSVTLKLYNKMANRISNSARHALWEQSAKSAVNHSVKFAAQAWQVDDGVVRFQLPLRNEFAGLDWDAAISTLGHDVEVKAL